ncbi:syntaxin-8 isoform 1-T1 [Anomaloglossus baeobatrachus]|uniref:syntaxin-8 isoform X1 n=1 Tax=Anomaloglossus baeobatrachus TaxID=238106 RepID=UPI003F4F79F1
MDPWLSAYDSSYDLAQEIAEKIHQRNRYLRNGENPVKINVTIRSLMKRLNENIGQLRDSLLRSVSSRQITQLEGDRRQTLVDELLTKERQLQMSFKFEGPEPDVIRSSLMSGGGASGPTPYNPWVLEEPEETRGLGYGELRQQQQRMIQEQDAGLDALSSIIARQKQMGYDIGNELDEQNEGLRIFSGKPPAVVPHHVHVPSTLASSLHLLDILMKSFSLLFDNSTNVFRKVVEMGM